MQIISITDFLVECMGCQSKYLYNAKEINFNKMVMGTKCPVCNVWNPHNPKNIRENNNETL